LVEPQGAVSAAAFRHGDQTITRRLRIQRHNELLYRAIVHTGAVCHSCHCRGIRRINRTYCRVPQPHFGVRHYRRHARGLSHGPRIEWILYELSWNQKGEGFEYHLLAIGLALVVILSGAGKWSIDRLLARRLGVQRGMIADLNRRLPSDIQPAPEHGAMISTKQ
jgi:hypothetical protein